MSALLNYVSEIETKDPTLFMARKGYLFISCTKNRLYCSLEEHEHLRTKKEPKSKTVI